MIRYAFEKVGMTGAFEKSGESLGVTLLKLLPGKVLRHEKCEDGRNVVVVEYVTGRKKNLVRGWVVEDVAPYAIGSDLQCPEWASGQSLSLTGTSKGRGFQDVITRHGFGGGPASHGSRFHRSPGSVGMRTEPGRTPRGKKMPGQFGQARVTVKGASVFSWSSESAVMAVQGGVPGAPGSVIFV